MVAPAKAKFNYSETRNLRREKPHFNDLLTNLKKIRPEYKEEGKQVEHQRLQRRHAPVRKSQPEFPVADSAIIDYFLTGGFAGAGAAGWLVAGADFTPCKTDVDPLCLIA
jgi:hypothetical protein